jgi:hypothetical protein
MILRGGGGEEAPSLFIGRGDGGPWRVEGTAGAAPEGFLPASGPWLRVTRAGKTLRVSGSRDGQLWSEPGAPLEVGWIEAVGVAVAGRGGAARATLSAPVRLEVRDHYYPGADECMACHNASSHYLLGASTRQWNRTVAGTNQLVLASQRGLLDTRIAPRQPDGWKRLAALDDASATLEDRARSYLDANCSQCHRPGNVVQVSIDARYDTPLARQGLIEARVRWPRSQHSGELVVAPHEPARSRLYNRVAAGSMPPLGSLLKNELAAEVLREWINGL